MNEEPVRNRERDVNKPLSTPSDPTMPEHSPDTPPSVGVYDRPARSGFPIWLVIVLVILLALLIWALVVAY